MIRTVISGLTLLVLCALSRAQIAPPQAAGSYLDVGGSKIWYEECGPASPGAPAVVLLHDGLVHSITWNEVWKPLCARYHVLRYDRRGYGRSDPAKSPFVPEDDLARVMRQAHMDRAVIVGNSSGAGLALDFALAHPEMAEGLVLIGPVVHGRPSSTYFNQRGSANSAPLDHGDARGAAENWSKDRFLIAGDDPAARKSLYDALAQNPQNLKVAGGMEIRPSPPAVLRLSQIKTPALVLVGEADIGDVFAYAGAIEAALPVVSFEIWKDTGHLIQLQRPTDLVARLNRFIPLAERKEASVPERKLAQYAGQYMAFNRLTTVMVKEGHLVLEFPGDPYRWLFAASETRFFLRTSEAEIEFQKNAEGKVTEMTIHNSDGSVIRCPRVDSAK